MTNAPFMLNVDCDNFANNPQIVLHAMCPLLGVKERESGFVQCPTFFYDALKDDPFGNQMIVTGRTMMQGVMGIQGLPYTGTGCFHRRKVIYGLSPDDSTKFKGGYFTSMNGLDIRFGNSMNFTTSAAQTLSGLNVKSDRPIELSSLIEVAHQVAACGYEYGSDWGTKVGWVYGTIMEDIPTGIKIHAKGWKSACCAPESPGFLGGVPTGGPATLTQQKRWATGLLEVLLSENNPLVATLNGKLQFRQCLAYMCVMLFSLRSIPELCYAVLPAYCIITNSNFLPKVQEPAILIPISLFVLYNSCTISDYFQAHLSIRAWWNNQRMARIISASAWLFGVLSVTLKFLGLSEIVFDVTQKDQSSTSKDSATIDAGKFTFDESPLFVPGTTVVAVHLIALVIQVLGFQPKITHGAQHAGSGIGELFCSVWVLLMFSHFVKGLTGKGKYGIPSSTICKSTTLALLFVCLCILGPQ